MDYMYIIIILYYRNVHGCIFTFICPVPDIHIDAKLSAVHLMLDKRQLEIIKGLIDMNLGEHIEEFEKPSSVILDPVAQVSIHVHVHVFVWTVFSNFL